MDETIDEIIVDNKEVYEVAKEFLQFSMPEQTKKLKPLVLQTLQA